MGTVFGPFLDAQKLAEDPHVLLGGKQSPCHINLDHVSSFIQLKVTNHDQKLNTVLSVLSNNSTLAKSGRLKLELAKALGSSSGVQFFRGLWMMILEL